MKVRNSKGELKELVIKANDSIPAGSVIEFDGDVVPEGYEKVEDKGEVYSTEEQRIGTWIDGKPLYRIIKEYDVSAKETQSNDISSIPYDTIFINFGKSFNRWVVNSSSSIIWNTSDDDKGNVWINYGKKLNILNSSNATRHYWITLEYTKTTD